MARLTFGNENTGVQILYIPATKMIDVGAWGGGAGWDAGTMPVSEFLEKLGIANLIDAALEMRKALEEIKRLSSWPVIGGEHSQIVKLAEAALAKARGE